MTGIDDPYEIPKNPEVCVETGNGVSKEVDQIMDYLYSKGLLNRY